MNNNDCIGVFDSGLGGLTVVKSIIEAMPDENIVYFGDTAHVPYGTRSKLQIIKYVVDDIYFLMHFNVKAIAIACNTADSVAREEVSPMFDVPIFGVVEPASRKAAHTTENGKIGIIATNATIDSGAYEKSIHAVDPTLTVIGQPCPLLVPLVENSRYKRNDLVIETVLREYLEPLREQKIDTLLLGCTHYPLLTDIISYIMPEVNIISSSEAAASSLKNELMARDMLCTQQGGKREYYVSDKPEAFEKTAKIFLGDMPVTQAKHMSEVITEI